MWDVVVGRWDAEGRRKMIDEVARRRCGEER
jgi:hypothetical protein